MKIKYNVKCTAFVAYVQRECGQSTRTMCIDFEYELKLTFIVNACTIPNSNNNNTAAEAEAEKNAYKTQCENVNQIDRTEIAPKQKFREPRIYEKKNIHTHMETLLSRARLHILLVRCSVHSFSLSSLFLSLSRRAYFNSSALMYTRNYFVQCVQTEHLDMVHRYVRTLHNDGYLFRICFTFE